MRGDFGLCCLPEVTVGDHIPTNIWSASPVAQAVECAKGESVCEGGSPGLVCLWEGEDACRQLRSLGVEGRCEVVVRVEVGVPDRLRCGLQNFGVVGRPVSQYPPEEPSVAGAQPALVCGRERGRVHPIQQLWDESGVEDLALPLWGESEATPETL